MSIAVLYWTLIEEFWKFTLKGWFCPKPPFLLALTVLHVTCLQVRGYVFRLIAFRLVQEGPTVCPSWIDFLWDWTVSVVEAVKVTQISLSEPFNDRSLVTQLQVTVCVFRLNYALHGTMEGLVVCTFFEDFCMNYRFSVSRLLNNLLYIRNLDDVTNTVARSFSFSAKR